MPQDLLATFVVQDNYIIVFLTLAVAQIVAAIGWAVNVNVKLKELTLRSDRQEAETLEIRNKQTGTDNTLNAIHTQVSVMAESLKNLTNIVREMHEDMRK